MRYFKLLGANAANIRLIAGEMINAELGYRVFENGNLITDDEITPYNVILKDNVEYEFVTREKFIYFYLDKPVENSKPYWEILGLEHLENTLDLMFREITSKEMLKACYDSTQSIACMSSSPFTVLQKIKPRATPVAHTRAIIISEFDSGRTTAVEADSFVWFLSGAELRTGASRRLSTLIFDGCGAIDLPHNSIIEKLSHKDFTAYKTAEARIVHMPYLNLTAFLFQKIYNRKLLLSESILESVDNDCYAFVPLEHLQPYCFDFQECIDYNESLHYSIRQTQVNLAHVSRITQYNCAIFGVPLITPVIYFARVTVTPAQNATTFTIFLSAEGKKYLRAYERDDIYTRKPMKMTFIYGITRLYDRDRILTNVLAACAETNSVVRDNAARLSETNLVVRDNAVKAVILAMAETNIKDANISNLNPFTLGELTYLKKGDLQSDESLLVNTIRANPAHVIVHS